MGKGYSSASKTLKRQSKHRSIRIIKRKLVVQWRSQSGKKSEAHNWKRLVVKVFYAVSSFHLIQVGFVGLEAACWWGRAEISPQ